MRNATTLLVVSLLFSMSAGADCVLPAPPSHIPDGHSANEQEMKSAMRTLQQYNDDVNEYTQCLVFQLHQNHLTADDVQKHQTDALNTLATVAGHFNEQVRIFKTRHS
jgi:hypothetical protein